MQKGHTEAIGPHACKGAHTSEGGPIVVGRSTEVKFKFKSFSYARMAVNIVHSEP